MVSVQPQTLLPEAQGTTPYVRPAATPRARNASSQERALWDRCRALIPVPPPPGEQGQWTPTACTKDGQPGEAERLTNPRRPSSRQEKLPGQCPGISMVRNVQNGMQAEGPVPGAHARTPATTACGQRTPTAGLKGGQPQRGKRLMPDTPQEGMKQPPGTPSCDPHSAQERALRGPPGVACAAVWYQSEIKR